MPRISQEEADGRLEKLATAFSPSAPVDRRDLFAGRLDQLNELLYVGDQRGQHGVVHGERGVGKTSLATIATAVMQGPLKRLAVRTNCDGTDDFSSIWRKVLAEIVLVQERPGVGFKGMSRKTVTTAAGQLPAGDVRPDDVRRVLATLSDTTPIVVFIDEFDRLERPDSRKLFADTIKTLSDHGVSATIVLVGVADNVEELVAEHSSVQRALVQIHMPRMSQDELLEIVQRGLSAAEMDIEPVAAGRITHLSQGLPHYTHLITQSAGRAAALTGTTTIDVEHVRLAIAAAVKRAQENIITAYHKGTSSSRETLYEEVLLACALAKGDDLGYFAAADVRAPLSRIMRRRYDIPAFSRHLNALSETARGPVLQKSGMSRRFRFRFINPLLQPYVIMRGIDAGRIAEADLGV